MKKCFNCGKEAFYHIEIERLDSPVVLSEDGQEFTGFDICEDCYNDAFYLDTLDNYDNLEWVKFYFVSPDDN